MATPTEVAQWMLEKLTRDGALYPAQKVSEIKKLFGAEHMGTDEHRKAFWSRTHGH
jgi:hypothetical protein